MATGQGEECSAWDIKNNARVKRRRQLSAKKKGCLTENIHGSSNGAWIIKPRSDARSAGGPLGDLTKGVWRCEGGRFLSGLSSNLGVSTVNLWISLGGWEFPFLCLEETVTFNPGTCVPFITSWNIYPALERPCGMWSFINIGFGVSTRSDTYLFSCKSLYIILDTYHFAGYFKAFFKLHYEK